jgi:hypothetical protein
MKHAALKFGLIAAATLALLQPVGAATLRIGGANDILTFDPHGQNHQTTLAYQQMVYETLVRYNTRQPEIVLEGAQLQLKHGITTVRDSYGMLLPLVATRDRIDRGEAVGARILAAGNIVGWGGPYSISFALIREAGLTLFQEQINDQITQGAGEDLVDMTPDELRTAINAYLDKRSA